MRCRERFDLQQREELNEDVPWLMKGVNCMIGEWCKDKENEGKGCRMRSEVITADVARIKQECNEVAVRVSCSIRSIRLLLCVREQRGLGTVPGPRSTQHIKCKEQGKSLQSRKRVCNGLFK